MVVLRLLEWASRCFSVVEGNSASALIHAFSFLVAESPWNSMKQSETLTTHNANLHCCVPFHSFVGQLFTETAVYNMLILNLHTFPLPPKSMIVYTEPLQFSPIQFSLFDFLGSSLCFLQVQSLLPKWVLPRQSYHAINLFQFINTVRYYFF